MSTNSDVRERASHNHNNNGISGTGHASSTTANKHSAPMDTKSILQYREKLVLWRRPDLTLYYFLLEAITLFQEFLQKLWQLRIIVTVLLCTFLSLFFIYHQEGSHQIYVSKVETKVLWCLYWVGLGILSSVGLGTGLHTFVLYLGPHIAAVTLAAFECMSVDFPSPPYPDDIVCPDTEEASMSVWTIMSKVRLEAFMWGAGTAIGELPPYFMARAARLSGQIDEEEQELEELISESRRNPQNLSFLQRGKIWMHGLVQKAGFIGILLAASIPNPLFDLAGITCGHFLVPFWTFFGATLIGKAIIKMHIQKLFVIFTFSEHHVEQIVSLFTYLPYGESIQEPFKDYLHKQKAKLHKGADTAESGDGSLVSWVFEKFILIMVVYFLVSILHSMAQSYHKRLTDKQKQQTNGAASRTTDRHDRANRHID